MIIVECPHCYTHVVPTSEGECPACRKNIHDVADTDPARTSISIPHSSQLPPNCCHCGRPTDRYVKVVRKISRKTERGDSTAGVFFLLGLFVSCLLLPFALILGLRERSGDFVVVRIPQCEVRAKNGKPAPIRVNSEELKMTFVVHKDFKKQIAEQSTSSDEATTDAT